MGSLEPLHFPRGTLLLPDLRQHTAPFYTPLAIVSTLVEPTVAISSRLWSPSIHSAPPGCTLSLFLLPSAIPYFLPLCSAFHTLPSASWTNCESVFGQQVTQTVQYHPASLTVSGLTPLHPSIKIYRKWYFFLSRVRYIVSLCELYQRKTSVWSIEGHSCSLTPKFSRFI